MAADGCLAWDNDLIRLVTDNQHPPYGHRSGIIRCSYRLLRENILGTPEQGELRNILDWFNEHLARPERLSVSRHPRAKGTAVSWIRASAYEHLSRLRRLAALVESRGTAVFESRTKRPGYVVYEDAYQVVALPFADTPR
jgi:hypothetical protein